MTCRFRGDRISAAGGVACLGLSATAARAASDSGYPTLAGGLIALVLFLGVVLLTRRRLELQGDVLREVFPFPRKLVGPGQVSAVRLAYARGFVDPQRSTRLPWQRLELELADGSLLPLSTSVDSVELEMTAARIASAFWVPLHDGRGTPQGAARAGTPFYLRPRERLGPSTLPLTDPRRPEVVPLPEGTLIRFGSAESGPQASAGTVLLVYGSFLLLVPAGLALVFGLVSGHLADVVGSPLFLGAALVGVLMQRQAGRRQWVLPVYTLMVSGATFTFTSPGGASRTLPLDSIEEFRVSEDPDRDRACLALRSGGTEYTLDGFEPEVLHDVETAVREALANRPPSDQP